MCRSNILRRPNFLKKTELVCLFVLGLEHKCHYCVTAIAVFAEVPILSTLYASALLVGYVQGPREKTELIGVLDI